MAGEEVFVSDDGAGFVGRASWGGLRGAGFVGRASWDNGRLDGTMTGSMGYVDLTPHCEIGCCLGTRTASGIIVSGRSNTDGDSSGGSLAIPSLKGTSVNSRGA